MTRPPAYILPVVVAAQFAGGTVWFAGNAVLPQLQAHLGFDGGLGAITGATQLGFIVGTALMALSGLADRFEARAVFLFSAVIAAASNTGVLWATDRESLIALRFVVGLALAGVYPVGMKAVAGWYQGGLGRALGFLVGALVLGTAFPHLVGSALPWRWTLVTVSALALAGGLAMWLAVPDGPFVEPSRFDIRAIPRLLRIRAFRGAALGYFGHMWELYTLWAFVPVLIASREALPVSTWSFVVIAVGTLGCVGGGLLAPRFGSARVAAVQLAISGACCLALPWARHLPDGLFLAFLLVWGVAVVGDSPQYSSVNARSAPPELVGTGLAFVTSVGFGLTVISISLAERFADVHVGLAALAIGPLLGLWGLRQTRARGGG